MKTFPRASAHPGSATSPTATMLVLLALVASPLAAEDETTLALKSAVDDAPLDLTALRNVPASPALKTFLATGRNVYVGDPDAAREGRERYEQWCQICHLADASGRMGPSLVDDVHNYRRSHTDLGLFEVIYGGAAGAMQPFDERLTGDEILKVIAYVRSLAR